MRKKEDMPTTPPESVDVGSPPKKFATRADVAEAQDIKTEDVWVPEWDTWVRLKGLTEAELALYQKQGLKTVPDPDDPKKEIQVSDETNSSARLLQHTLVGEDGERLFDDSPASFEVLKQRSGMVMLDLATKASKLSGIGVDSVEDAAGNSGATTDDA